MKSFYKSLLLCMFFIGFTNFLFAQNNKIKSAKEFKNEQIKEMQNFREDQAKGMQDILDKRTKYIQRMDAEFSAYLKERWQEFQAFKGVKSSDKPKPVRPLVAELPVVKPHIRPQESVVPLPTKPIVKLPFVAAPLVIPVLPTVKKADFPTQDINVTYYGTPIRIQYDHQLDAINIASLNEEEIGKVWSEISKINYASLVQQLVDARSRMNLNDWAYYQLIRQFSDDAFQKDTPKSIFVTWFIMTKSGFKVRLGRDANQFLLMVAVKQNLYGITYINLDDVKYYILSNYSSESLFTYRKNFPEANHIMDMSIASPPVLYFEPKQTTVNTGKDNLIVRTNQNLLTFYNDYPQCDLEVYFSAQPSQLFKESMANFILGKTGEEALSFLLSFIQKLNYLTDTKQFGKEKFMFPDEFFFYPASDCDDRAILFAYLSRELVHFNAIGLNYIEHISTAVTIPGKKTGDYVIYKNIRYSVCDPTYVGASIGQSMPQFKNVSAGIIEPY